MEGCAVDAESANVGNVSAAPATGRIVMAMHVNVLCVSVVPLLMTQGYVPEMDIVTVMNANVNHHGQVCTLYLYIFANFYVSINKYQSL